jgi:hypothetical protein
VQILKYLIENLNLMQQHDQSELFTLGKLDDIEVAVKDTINENEKHRVRMPLYYLKFFMQEAIAPNADLNKVLREYLIIFRRDHYDITSAQLKEYLNIAKLIKPGKNYLKNFGVEEINPEEADLEKDEKSKVVVNQDSDQPIYRIFPYKFMFAFLIRNCSKEDYLRKLELFVHMFDSDNNGILTREELIKGFTFYNPDDEEVLDNESIQFIVNEILNSSSEPLKDKISLKDLTKFVQEIDINSIDTTQAEIPTNPLKQ